MYRIITDSACDLKVELIKQYKIEMIPIYIYNEDKEYRDKVSIMPEKMYSMMDEGAFFKTAQIPPKIFEDSFRNHLSKGDKCLYIGFSSGISSTFNSSVVARENVLKDYPKGEIIVFDSRLTCGMLGLAVLEAAKMLDANRGIEEIIDMLEHYRDHGEHIFTVDNIEYLFKGGRVSRTSAIIGGMLNIKPILEIRDGKLEILEKIRGRKKAMNRMADIIKERNHNICEQTVAVGHSNDMKSKDLLIEKITRETECQNYIIEYMGGAIAAHTGPGILAVFFLNKLYNE
jgi:DegV family protein with EDD domain